MLASVHDILSGASLALALLFLKHSRELKNHGLAWLGVGFGLYAVNHEGLPWLRETDLTSGWIVTFAAGTAGVSIAALSLGIQQYGAPTERPLGRAWWFLIVASVLFAVLLLLLNRLSPNWVHGVPATILSYGAYSQFRMRHRAAGMGSGWVGAALSAHGLIWLILLLIGTDPKTVTEILSIPYVAAGLTLLSVTLTRSSRELRGTRDSLANLNQSLEQRVQQRTEELKKANQQLHEWSFLDGLTQLANRRRFDDAIDLEVDRLRQDQAMLSLLLLDVDHFKSYNDQYGHQLGDECLRRLADVFRNHARRVGQVAARYGGEEFAILLPSLNGTKALVVAESIRRDVAALEIPHQADGGTVTISIGLATARGRCTVERLLHHADKQLYAAKDAGRDCIRAIDLDDE